MKSPITSLLSVVALVVTALLYGIVVAVFITPVDDDVDNGTKESNANTNDRVLYSLKGFKEGVTTNGVVTTTTTTEQQLSFESPIVFSQFSSDTCDTDTVLYTGSISEIRKIDENIFCTTEGGSGDGDVKKYTKHTNQKCTDSGVIDVYQTCTDDTCMECDNDDDDDESDVVYTSFTAWDQVFPTEFKDHCFQQIYSSSSSNSTATNGLFDNNPIDVDYQFDTDSTENAFKYHEFIIDNSCMKDYAPSNVNTDSPSTTTTTESPTESPTDSPTSSEEDTSTEEPTDSPTEEPTNSPTSTDEPTEEPTNSPTATDEPTEEPTNSPTEEPTGTNNDNDNQIMTTDLEFYIPNNDEGLKLSISFEETTLASYELPLAHGGPVLLNDGLYDGVLFTSNHFPVNNDNVDDDRQRVIVSFYNFTSKETINLELSESIPMASGAFLMDDGNVAVLSQGTMTENGGIFTWNPNSGSVTSLTTSWGQPVPDTPFNSPNNIVQALDGSLWFTDPQYGYDQQLRPEPEAGNWVWRYDPETNTSRKVADGFIRPNGLAFSPNEEFLYVSDSGDDNDPDNQMWPTTIYRYRVSYTPFFGKSSEPFLTDRTVFAVSSKGIYVGTKVDSFGNVWKASEDGIEIYYPSGVLLGFIPIDGIGDGGVTNFALSEKEDTIVLYVMNQTRLIQIVGTIQDVEYVGNNPN